MLTVGTATDYLELIEKELPQEVSKAILDAIQLFQDKRCLPTDDSSATNQCTAGARLALGNSLCTCCFRTPFLLRAASCASPCRGYACCPPLIPLLLGRARRSHPSSSQHPAFCSETTRVSIRSIDDNEVVVRVKKLLSGKDPVRAPGHPVSPLWLGCERTGLQRLSALGAPSCSQEDAGCRLFGRCVSTGWWFLTL